MRRMGWLHFGTGCRMKRRARNQMVPWAVWERAGKALCPGPPFSFCGLRSRAARPQKDERGANRRRGCMGQPPAEDVLTALSAPGLAEV